MTHHDDARLDDLLAHLDDGDSKDLFRTLLQRGMQGLIDVDAALSQEFFDVALRQAVPQVPAHRQQHDVRWEPVPSQR